MFHIYVCIHMCVYKKYILYVNGYMCVCAYIWVYGVCVCVQACVQRNQMSVYMSTHRYTRIDSACMKAVGLDGDGLRGTRLGRHRSREPHFHHVRTPLTQGDVLPCGSQNTCFGLFISLHLISSLTGQSSFSPRHTHTHLNNPTTK